MKWIATALTSGFLLLASAACDISPRASNNVGGSISDPVVNVENDDSEMDEAIRKARETFPQFIEKFETMQSSEVSVKFGVQTIDGDLEHIWFEPIEISDQSIKAICENDPVNVPGLKLGDVRIFERAKLSDWMILVGNKCYGGFTIRVLANKQPEMAPPFEFADF